MIKNIKDFILIPVSLFIIEIINTAILFLFPINNEFLLYFIITIVSLVFYYIVGSKFFIKINDNKKKKALILASILVVLSYIITLWLTETFNIDSLLCHLPLGSPIANLMTYLLNMNYDYSYEISVTLLSPVNVFCIWIFSKKWDIKKILKILNK